jgi:hypothetical protein
MKHRAALLAVTLASTGCPKAPPSSPPPPPPSTDVPAARDVPAADAGDPNAPTSRLTPFRTRDALTAWLRARNAPVRNRGGGFGGIGAMGGGIMAAEAAASAPVPAAPTAAPAPPMAQAATGAAPAARRAERSASADGAQGNAPGSPPNGSDSITNNQVEGVDEGDIVKMHGQHLVVLRRGRLFSVRLGDDRLTPVSMVDAYGRGRQPGGWYDEMLIDGNTIVVIGYSYRATASEVGLFDIDAEGNIRWRDTLFVRSSDYYSARNYASRLVGHHLVMYMPVPLRFAAGDEMTLPAIRHTPDGAWETVMDYERVYRPVQEVGWQPMIHTVMSCDLSNRGFNCRSVGVVGPDGRNFYVSGGAVYLWVNGQPRSHWVAATTPWSTRDRPPRCSTACPSTARASAP